jgi:hypothetical protein
MTSGIWGLIALALGAQATPDAAGTTTAPAGAAVVEPLDAAAADPAEAARPPACGVPGQAPDPRCNETLDGRAPPPSSPGRRAAQAVLAPPRVAAHLVLQPVVAATEATERHQVFPWLRAITTSDDGTIGVRPEIQYATGFTPSVGAHLFYRRLPDPTSEVDAGFRAGSAQIMHGELALRGPHWLGLTVGGMWDRRDDRLFAGIGNPAPGAPNPVESRYRGDIYRVEMLWLTPGDGPLKLILRAGVERRDYGVDSVRGGPSIATAYGASPASCAARGLPFPCTDPTLVPGFGDDRRLFYERARLALDLRPGGRDRSGVEFGLDGSVLHGFAGDPSSHARLGFDGVGAVGGGDRVLLLRYVAAVVQPFGSAQIPFDELISPCGSLGMRGLPDGLLRDRSGMVGTAESRWLISSGIDAALFLDEGAVAGAWFQGIDPGHFHTTVGVGVRFYRQDRARYWEDAAMHGLQLAWAPGRNVRLLLTAAVF